MQTDSSTQPIDNPATHANSNADALIGAFASIGMGMCYVIMFIIFGALLNFPQTDVVSEKIQYVADNQALLGFSYTLGYLLFGCLLLITTLVVHSKFKTHSSLMNNCASAFGFIWVVLMMCSGMIALVGMNTMFDLQVKMPAEAQSLFYSYNMLVNALGGGIELVGGLWVLLISIIGLREKQLSKPLHMLGIMVGSLGVLTLAQSIDEFKMAFGLSQIVWFFWLGVALLKSRSQ